MSTRVCLSDKRTDAPITFGQIEVGQWFTDEYGYLCCKLGETHTFCTEHGLCTNELEDEVTLVEEIRIEIVK